MNTKFKVEGALHHWDDAAAGGGSFLLDDTK